MTRYTATTLASRIYRAGHWAGALRPGHSGQAVSFVPTDVNDRRLYRVWTRLLAYGSLVVLLLVIGILFQPAHWVFSGAHADPKLRLVNMAMLLCLALLHVFLLINTYMSARSTLRARNPVPLNPPEGLRVALITTRAPGEPVELVTTTLKAATQVRYENGTVDVWLLDETKSSELAEICERLGVRYFSRKDVAGWNTLPRHRRLFRNRDLPVESTDPRLAARTKHGNLNAWGHSIQDSHYDIIAGVDTDQVPQPYFLERLLGYFHDPDVAYVVGPQVYANGGPGLRGLVTRWAESQASFFQGTIQRAANASTVAMFVGTNYAVRTKVLAQVNGYYPCITEDLATGIAIHRCRNASTGNFWKSVYTPDVLALGEGPRFWSHYFSQQWRWAAGAYDTIRQLFIGSMTQLPRRARLHYLLVILFYPLAALTWVLGVVSSLLYLWLGASAVQVPWNQFISLYLMSTVLQLGIYFWNKRADVSPMTVPGSYGVTGMLMTSLTAPVYFSALIGVLLKRRTSFVVTQKGDSANPDWFKAFATHLRWAALLAASLVYGLAHNHASPAILFWVGMQLAVCLTPFVLGMSLAYPERRRAKRSQIVPIVPAMEASHV